MDYMDLDYKEINFDFSEGKAGKSFALINRTPPKYDCPIHGKVNDLLYVYLEGKTLIFCSKCYADFMKKNVTLLEEEN
jgi:hypothetical protein